MGRLTDAFPLGALVGLDTMAFIYHIEQAPPYAAVVRPFFEALEQGALRAVTSVLTLMELAVRPLQMQRPEVADDYELLLVHFPNLTIVDVDRTITRRAAELRAAYRLRPADALQVGTALAAGAGSFVTNDRTLSRVEGLQIVLIDDYVDRRPECA